MITLRDVVDTPEVNVFAFAFLLNLPWELLQVPFFSALPESSHWSGIVQCGRAALGDALITVSAYAAVAARHGRHWIFEVTLKRIGVFVALGLVVTIIIEAVSTGPLRRWTYADSMPTLPMLGTGLLPILQWVMLPPLVVWTVRRQLADRRDELG